MTIVNFEKYDNSTNNEGPKSTNSIRGPVVVKVATAITSASSNNNPNIARIMVIKARLTMNNIKKIHAIKTEISRPFRLILEPAIDEGLSNLPVSFEKAENNTDIRRSLIPPAVVAIPPPNKHKPSSIILI